MKVDLLDREMVDSDLGVVNAARCSFDKQSAYAYVHKISDEACEYDGNLNPTCQNREHYAFELYDRDIKLIYYLATHQHWTPFAHAQEAFDLRIQDQEIMYFLYHANLAGFEWEKTYVQGSGIQIRGSLYAWLTNYQHLTKIIADPIIHYLHNKYSVSSEALIKDYTVSWISNAYVWNISYGYNSSNDMTPYTLRLHVPIFVKRQLETHRRNFVMTDIEDFAQNEVSRRYIDTEPEVYTPGEWRIQAIDKKQGSSDNKLDRLHASLAQYHYNQHMYHSKAYYTDFNTQYRIAHEQSRMILPLSTYTTFWWTGSLKSWKRLFGLRLKPDVQDETRKVVQMCYEVIKESKGEI